MKSKKYTRFQVDFSSKWTSAFGVLMGLSFFLRIVYYLGLVSLRDVGILELLTSAILGILLCGGSIVCSKYLHMDAPGLYGMMGAAQCLLVFLLTCTNGGIGRILLALVWYCLAALVLLATVGGYLPGKLLAACMFAVPAVIRLLFFDLGKIGVIRWVQEFAVLCALSAFACFAMGLKHANKK